VFSLLDQVADVYTETAATGKFTTRIISGLVCRMVSMTRLAHDMDQRVELVGVRHLMYDGQTIIPENCQVDMGDGIRWAPRPGTFYEYRDWNGTITYKSCWVERQAVGSLST
jgi:hypothetical protein